MDNSAANRSRMGMLVALTVAIVLIGATPASAISRTLVMSRAQQWIDKKIPYTQTGWADETGEIVTSPADGWRRDCSGFTSMAWNLPKTGASTRTLHNYATLVTKEALQPGDALVAYDSHAVVFGGWADSLHASYYAYEMSSSQSDKTGDGTVCRVTPYPYWGADTAYKPYRLNGITENIDYSPFIAPVAGSNRYNTAVKASQTAFGDGSAEAVVIASGTNWPDALGAAALAGAVDGPILLTDPARLSDSVIEEIGRLGATKVLVIGGEAAVSQGVFDTLDALPSVEATRIGGTNRYDTARLIADETVSRIQADGGTFDGTVFVATGLNFPDALAASAFAADAGRPILLSAPTALSAEASSAIRSTGATRTIMLGGPSALSSQITSDLASMVGTEGVTRLYGSNRYTTAGKIIDFCLPESSLGFGGLAIATGDDFPDALAGGVMASHMGTFLGLTPKTCLNPDVAQRLLVNTAETGTPHVLGGETVILPIVRESIALALGGV
ncbi:MAG: cell wall-binding repeat-containing protein [Coriobacteriia bacterium]|nr:cell wall-binding repeat-containing protein [Coriobacteriia bacterium]